jgi:glutathione peroxidase
MKSIHLILLLFATVGIMSESTKSFYDFSMKNIQGKEVPLSSYKGKAVLVINVASKCGYTPQYEGLESLHKKYKDKGLAIVGFPANNFGAQEPGSNEEIAKFCKMNYGVSFDMMSKISVKGSDQDTLYKYLTSEAPEKGDVKWNFEKFLISKNGKIVGRFASGVSPDSKELIQAIEKEIQ